MKRRFFFGLAALAVLPSAWPQERVVKVLARKFTFEPEEIALKVGEPVVLEFTTADVHMGFKCVELGVRADILPGQVTRLKLTPEKAGTFGFFCDVFCGDDHELMSGTLTITA